MQVSRERFYRLSQELEGRKDCIEDLRDQLVSMEQQCDKILRAVSNMTCECYAEYSVACDRCTILDTYNGGEFDDRLLKKENNACLTQES